MAESEITAPLVAALGRVTSGIYILTAGAGDRSTGMLASWVQQAGFEPPAVTVAVKRDRYIGDWLTDREPFVLNVVGEGQKEFLKHFGKGFEPGEAAFDGIETVETAAGTPALAGAVASLECRPTQHFDSGDHRVFLAEVTGGSLRSETKPMVHLRRRGDHY